MLLILTLLAGIAFTQTAYADTCQLIEYADHSEVVCTGASNNYPVSNRSNSTTTLEEDKWASKEKELERLLNELELLKKKSNEGHLVFCTPTLNEVQNSNHSLTLNCRASVTFSGDLSIDVAGKNVRGVTLKKVSLGGYAYADRDTLLAERIDLTPYQHIEIVSWDVIRTKVIEREQDLTPNTSKKLNKVELKMRINELESELARHRITR